MIKKLIRIASAVAAIAAAAAVCIVALAFALYAALKPAIGPAWSAAAVAGTAALIVVVVALLLGRRAQPEEKGDDRDLATKVFDLARDKPMVAVAAVAAAGLVALRNPKITAALVGAFMAGRAPKK